MPARDVIASITFHIDKFLPPNTDGSIAAMAESDVIPTVEHTFLIPLDSKLLSSRSDTGNCKVMKMHSDTIAGAVSGVAPSGNFIVELTRPISDGAAPYDPHRIGEVLITLDTSVGC